MLEQLQDLGHRELADFDYALINPLRVHASRRSDLVATPLTAAAFKAQPHLVPLLLPLRHLANDGVVDLLDLNAEQVRETGQPMFCALLRSDVQVERLAVGLGARMLIDAPGGERAWLRYHDPRIFSALSWWTTPEQMACLLGDVMAWSWFEPRDARWHQLKRPSASPSGRLRLSPSQWDRLTRQPLVNRSLKLLGLQPLLDESLHALVERVDAHLCRASACGLVEEADLCLFAVMTERHGAAWTTHPVAAEALAAAANETQMLASGIKGIRDAELHEWMRASAGHMEEHA